MTLKKPPSLLFSFSVSLSVLIVCWLLLSPVANASTDLIEQTPEVISRDEIMTEMYRHLVMDNYENWAPGLNWLKLRVFYAKRDFYPVWISESGPSERARQVRDVLIEADLEGLDPVEYHTPALKYLWNARKSRSKTRLELLLTDAVLRYGLEVSAGYRNPRAADIDWYVRPKRINILRRLETVLISNNAGITMRHFAPPHRAYAKLKEKLAYYRLLAKKGAWQKVSYMPQVQVGMRHPQIVNVRKRLQQEAYLSSPLASPKSEASAELDTQLFDDALDVAVRKFQAHYGHKVDGVIGYFTRKSLNIGVNAQIARIKQNMERWRWMPQNLGRRYIMVNMAGYRLNLVNAGKSVMEMPVIIGKTFRATPAFSDTLEYIELNPTWKVPPRIAKEKFLPKLRENADFLQANNLKVYDSWKKSAKEVDPDSIDWNEVSDTRFPYKLEQTPGAHNSMGRIKFMFPNRFRVYLHDTPDKTLFARHVRTFSSGCIRVAQPFQLANKILAWDNAAQVADVVAEMEKGETIRIALKRKIPVYLMYWTAWVDEEGEIHFRNDIYQRNEKIATGADMGVS